MTSAEKKTNRWLVVLAGPARKSLNRLPSQDRIRVRAALDELEIHPFQGDLRKLKGSRHGFRRRVGDWRIFYDAYPDQNAILVTAVQRRTSATY